MRFVFFSVKNNFKIKNETGNTNIAPSIRSTIHDQGKIDPVSLL